MTVHDCQNTFKPPHPQVLIASHINYPPPVYSIVIIYTIKSTILPSNSNTSILHTPDGGYRLRTIQDCNFECLSSILGNNGRLHSNVPSRVRKANTLTWLCFFHPRGFLLLVRFCRQRISLDFCSAIISFERVFFILPRHMCGLSVCRVRYTQKWRAHAVYLNMTYHMQNQHIRSS
jgi:hypothetical protein